MPARRSQPCSEFLVASVTFKLFVRSGAGADLDFEPDSSSSAATRGPKGAAMCGAQTADVILHFVVVSLACCLSRPDPLTL